MTLTLQSVSNILYTSNKMQITQKRDPNISCSPQSSSEYESNSSLQEPDNHSTRTSPVTQNGSSEQLGISTYHPLPSFPSYSLSNNLSSPFHPPILNPAFVKSSKENYINPIFDAKYQQIILPIECGRNAAFMFLSKLCQGSKGPCILFKNCYWLTPNEFQFISGRETAKDWKRSIRHNGKSIKLLINKGILCVHSPLCECGTATASSIKMGKFSFDHSQFPEAGNYPEFHQRSLEESEHAEFHKVGAAWNSNVAVSQRGDLDSFETETDGSGSSPEWNFPRRIPIPRLHSSYNHHHHPTNLCSKEERDELILSVSVSSERGSPQSRSSDVSSSISTLTAAESQSEETSITGSGSAINMNNNNDSPTPPKSKRKSKSVAVKLERHSPQLSSSTTSPPMTPPPSNNSGNPSVISGGGSSPPPAPIKQMEQMMGSGRNYSDFMRSLAAKYNQQSTNINSEYYSRTSPANFAFDTRFLKPAAAAALLNLSCSQIPSNLFGGGDKEKFPMIDMSSTQTLLSMVRSASAAAANNLESLKTISSSSQSHKRPNSPLDLSSRDMPSTPPPPLKKSKLRNPLLDAKPVNTVATTSLSTCVSSCSTGCTEEAQTMINWSVEEVCRFVSNIELCKDYAEVFRENSIDGSSLPLLTEDHLMKMNMKLGPALKLRSTIARKLGTCVVCSHCTHCHNHNNNAINNSP